MTERCSVIVEGACPHRILVDHSASPGHFRQKVERVRFAGRSQLPDQGDRFVVPAGARQGDGLFEDRVTHAGSAYARCAQILGPPLDGCNPGPSPYAYV
ncbi:MAG TPA: hypothetical protein VK485_05715 [Sphingomicrobium sp.]|nr:hypothetical protein [Sphingomicrobium sp.]